jgi:hypothetical protein
MKHQSRQEVEAKRRKLLLREKTSVIVFCITWIPLLYALVLKYFLKINERDLWPLLVVYGVFVVWGVSVQLSLKCPYCGYRLARTAALLVPSSCPKCKEKLK